jgi:hypothetical protein
MKRLARGIGLLLLAACGESTSPPAASPAARPADTKSSSLPAPVADASPKPKMKIDKKGRSKSAELFTKYMSFMESNGDLLQSIEEDVEKKKGDAVIKPKVQKIIKNAEAARALHYRKDEDEDKAIDTDFDLFLGKMEKIAEATWDADSGKELLESLQRKCQLCHDKFQ